MTTWFSVFMKRGTPRHYVDAMALAIQKASVEPDLVQRLSAAGLELGLANSPDQFAAQQDADMKRFSGVVGKAALKFE
ncbi:Tripartite tricarboxylate transporter family receptor [compost metagenome]